MARLHFLIIAAAAALAACEPRGGEIEPPPATSASPHFEPIAGVTWTAFLADPVYARFSPSGLGLSEGEQARFAAAMSNTAPSEIKTGGGVSAVVFNGCAATGCADGRGVLAIDVETGGVFVGVRDAAGREILAPNDRMEALLRLSSPSREWDDPATAPASAQP